MNSSFESRHLLAKLAIDECQKCSRKCRRWPGLKPRKVRLEERESTRFAERIGNRPLVAEHIHRAASSGQHHHPLNGLSVSERVSRITARASSAFMPPMPIEPSARARIGYGRGQGGGGPTNHRRLNDRCREERPAVVSFHFGVPEPATIAALHDAGIVLFATATNRDEADRIADTHIDAIAAQGAEAGGHRGTFDPGLADELC
jgi:hypothetical protein